MAAFMKRPLWSGSGLGGLTEMGAKRTWQQAFAIVEEEELRSGDLVAPALFACSRRGCLPRSSEATGLGRPRTFHLPL